MTVKISYQQAVDLLELAVEERGPDFVYVYVNDSESGPKTCAYFANDGSPSCIVGWILNRLGIDAQMCFREDVNESSVDSLVTQEIIEIDFKTYTLLVVAQALQDGLTPWGQCLEVAKGCAEHIVDPTLENGETVDDIISQIEGWDYISEFDHYTGERYDVFRLNKSTVVLPLFEKIKAPGLVSEGVQTFQDDKGVTVTGEVFVEAK